MLPELSHHPKLQSFSFHFHQINLIRMEDDFLLNHCPQGCHRGRCLIQLGGDFEKYTQNTLFETRHSTVEHIGQSITASPQPMGQITLPPPTVSTAMLTSAFCQVIAYWFLQTTGFWRQMTGFHHYGTMPRPSTGPGKKSALKKMMTG